MSNQDSQNTVEKPNGLMILASVLMTAGSVITVMLLKFEFVFFRDNINFLSIFDIITAILAVVLIVMEVIYIFSVLRMLITKRLCDFKKMRRLAIWMLSFNCAMLFLSCFFLKAFGGWEPQGYFSLSTIMLFLLFPGIFVKIIALSGARQNTV